MPRLAWPVAAFLLLASVPVCVSGCKKDRPQTTGDPTATRARETPTVPPPRNATVSEASGAGPSESIAAGRSVRSPSHGPDAASLPGYYGKPSMDLDEKTLADVQRTIDATCELLEQGVDILEANAETPDKAKVALAAFHKRSATHIERIFKAADQVKARLHAAGYDQDIPREIRPAFEKRMGAIQTRLEKIRTVYRRHPDVLEAFGKLFPRGRP